MTWSFPTCSATASAGPGSDPTISAQKALSPADASAGLSAFLGGVFRDTADDPRRRFPYRLLQEVSEDVASALPFMLALPRATLAVYPPPTVPGVVKVMRPFSSVRYHGTDRPESSVLVWACTWPYVLLALTPIVMYAGVVMSRSRPV